MYRYVRFRAGFCWQVGPGQPPLVEVHGHIRDSFQIAASRRRGPSRAAVPFYRLMSMYRKVAYGTNNAPPRVRRGFRRHLLQRLVLIIDIEERRRQPEVN